MLEGKAVIVTGAAQGLGRAVAIAAASAGARVLVSDVDGDGARETVNAIVTGGGGADAFVASVAEWDAAAALVARCAQRFGSVDGLVNNAALFTTGPATEETPERMQSLVSVNVLGAMYCGTHALRAMRDRGHGGAIVNVTSAARAGRRNMGLYAATKGAVASLSYAWALEAADYAVRVNALAPRALTRMTLQGSDSPPDHSPPEHVAPVVVFLLSDRAATVTGQIVHFDGRGLALAQAPGLAVSLRRPEPWTPEQIAASFEATLLERLEPVGWTGGAVSGRPVIPAPLAP
jgi:NAD(P)-dependent dehydrogenase (short-subunit alcohol dehydrogenase family)